LTEGKKKKGKKTQIYNKKKKQKKGLWGQAESRSLLLRGKGGRGEGEYKQEV